MTCDCARILESNFDIKIEDNMPCRVDGKVVAFKSNCPKCLGTGRENIMAKEDIPEILFGKKELIPELSRLQLLEAVDFLLAKYEYLKNEMDSMLKVDCE